MSGLTSNYKQGCMGQSPLPEREVSSHNLSFFADLPEEL